MKQFLKRVNDHAVSLLGLIQVVIQSPLWFFGTIILTLSWMADQILSKHPVDNPGQGFPMTVLYYTLMSLWVENAVKVSQSTQSKMQQDQMNRLEFVLRSVAEMGERNEERDKVIHHLINVQNKLVQCLRDALVEKDGNE
jgi:uncharacterized membrane protein YjdF